MAIKKAIFVAAGFGTRFLPITKAVPKEMLPVVDKPIIQYLVEEAVEAGITEVIFVTGRGKNAIENHFDKSYELEQNLVEKSKVDLLDEVEKISKLANFAYVRQPVQKGDGHALLCAKPFIDPNESVLVIFPDYLMPAKSKSIQKMIEIYRQYHEPVICADTVDYDMVHRYGVMDFEETDNPEVVSVKKFVEKPKREDAPSNLINAGYYIITPKFIKILESSESSVGDGEIRVADAFVKLAEMNEPVYALKPQGSGYDCGDKIGYLKAVVKTALEREDTKDKFIEFIKETAKDL